MALTSVAASLRAFGPTTLVVRAVDAVLGTLGEPPVPHWATVGDAAAALDAPLAHTEAFAEDDRSREILHVGAAVDGADRAVARRIRAEDALGPQAEDAVLKLLMLGWLQGATHGALLDLHAGRTALLCWAAVDVVLPLGGADVPWMLEEHREQQTIRLVSLCGEAGMDRVRGGVDAVLPRAAEAVARAAPHADALALALAPFVPGLLASGDDAAANVALQGDRLPLYKWLATRIAAEYAASRARTGITGPT
ncbi:MAG: hypothetical protein R3F59_21990 [Myxococcota bacterium]